METLKTIFSKEFWPLKEIGYQGVHLLLGALISILVYSTSYPIVFVGIAAAFLAGLCNEIYQYSNGDGFKILDRIRDMIFWTLGGCVIFLF